MRSSQLPRGRVCEEDLPTIIGRNLGCIYDLKNPQNANYTPGVVTRFEPGVHEYNTDDFKVLPNSTNFFNREQFTVTDGKSRRFVNINGPNNLSATHLYATQLRVSSAGFDLDASRATMRKCDNSNFPIARIIKKRFPIPIVPNVYDEGDSKIVVNITPDGPECIEAPGLGVYAPPGHGKTVCQQHYWCRYADSDFIYSPNATVVTQLAQLNYTIFSNDYEILCRNVPTVMLIPSYDIMSDRIANKVRVPADIISSWITNLNTFINALKDNAARIKDAGQCVVIVHTNEENVYAFDMLKPLCREINYAQIGMGVSY